MVRYSLDVDESDGSELEYSSEEEEEPPHPLGFKSPTRYGLDDADGIQHYKLNQGYKFTDEYKCDQEILTSPSKYPPLHLYHDPSVSQQLLSPPTPSVPDTVNEIVDTLRESLSKIQISPLAISCATTVQPTPPDRTELEQLRARYQREHEEDRIALEKILGDVKAAKLKKQREREQAEQKLLDEKKADERARAQAKALEEKRIAQKKAAEQARKDREDAQKERERAANAPPEYVTKAEEKIKLLKKIRASVAPFEENKSISKRRLAMKKVVNGKINTLTEDAHKVREVAQVVTQTIESARSEDEQLKQRKEAGEQIPSEVARGKRYFIDLLSSKVIVRAQAESFNGQRGDGFPLAAMLAQCANDSNDLVPILTAHIYTVCPVSIPRLPTSETSGSDDAFMENLGMLRGNDGEFETFERFLSRTEGIISLMADIMSCQPSTHLLLGGNKGAVEWLHRFLSLLPDPPANPLPLLTAPVLDAFFKRAGHMLANVHEKHFRELLGKIQKDVLDRLDESPVGTPSAIRFRKTVSGGFDYFKSTLPSKAIPELYLGASGGGGPSSSHASGAQSSTKSPFATGGASPFGQSQGPSAVFQSPFGAGNTGISSGGFGSSSQGFGQAAAPNPSPFGGGGMASSESNMEDDAPFGQSQTQSSSFGGGQSAFKSNQPSTPFGQNASPFGGNSSGFGSTAAPNPSPFGSGTAFGQSQAPTSSATPFGGGLNSAPSPSPFGVGSAFGQSVANNPSPFGASRGGFGQTTGPSPSPSGFGGAPNPSPFGGSTPFGQSTAAPSTFGASSGFGGSTPFGNSQATSPSPFSSNSGSSQKQPCKFFAQGNCRFGNNCRFSHDLQNSNQTGRQFGGASPFGPPRR